MKPSTALSSNTPNQQPSAQIANQRLANIRRFEAPTAREALARARMAFGDQALILSNRSTARGVEIMATSEAALPPGGAASRPAASVPLPPLSPLPPVPSASASQSVQQDVAQLAMSTLSFQDYVRERMLRRRHAETSALAERPEAALPRPPAKTAPAQQPQTARPARQSVPAAAPAVQAIQGELQALRQLINERFNTLTWLNKNRQNALHAKLLHKLLHCGYSPELARALLQRLPANLPAAHAWHWLLRVLQHNLRTDAGQAPLHEAGGNYALLGPGGAGKTASAARLAAACAQQRGAASVGLITLGDERSGIHLPLRHQGRALGIVAHAAHDRSSLQDLLGLLAGKHLVLIDTPGLPVHDPRHARLHALLDMPGVQPLLTVNAASQGEMLDELLRAGKKALPQGSVFQGVLTRMDEAVKLAPVLDACIRHRLLLRACACGPRLLPDWERADAHQLVTHAMRTGSRSAFDPAGQDVDFFFLPPAGQERDHA